MSLEHKTSLKCQFQNLDLYSFPLIYGLLWFDNIWLRYNYLKIWNLRVQKNKTFEKITFKVVQIKFLAMHITNKKLSFDIFTVGNLLNIFMEYDDGKKKSAGPDGISAGDLKACADQICWVIHYIFNLSLRLERVPVLWKTSCVVPVPKKTNPTEFSQYRPIALMAQLIKVFERLVLNYIKQLLCV